MRALIPALDNLTVIASSWEDAEVAPADLVVCSHVLYAVAEPVPFLEKMESCARERRGQEDEPSDDELGGAPLAIGGSTLLWTLAHALSHPPEFLVAVAAAGLLLGLWRWACKDLVAPIIGHVIADIAL